jgi:hypothetical protein
MIAVPIGIASTGAFSLYLLLVLPNRAYVVKKVVGRTNVTKKAIHEIPINVVAHDGASETSTLMKLFIKDGEKLKRRVMVTAKTKATNFLKIDI